MNILLMTRYIFTTKKMNMNMRTESVRILVAVIILSTTLGAKAAEKNVEGVMPEYECEGNYVLV